ncbi:MAG: metal-dependent hydrolase [archaeon]|jgi:hypothetical protein|nr:metal-dependent hydrolase [archaeon]MDD2477950.1 metal-dependent hydrolase [Candidatus ainarchaeum sp.]MDD3084846.1 metal-dependent hydrolase [Candidatus ainarchaeum sp.]MDD4221254.1 metal-dependent hydrolase [Candidatus ainarchaeum sp.]MDD4662761.1 metal-dependent hydrolase [Candidatus ainarchaeum sp.]
MNKVGHILFGAILFLIVFVIVSDYYPLNYQQMLLAFFVCLVYSVLPDVDKSDSWIRKKLNLVLFYSILLLGILYFLDYKKVVLPILFLMGVEVVLMFSKHRGVFHTFAFGVLLAGPWLFLDKIYFFAALVGVLSHWIADRI